MKNSMSVKKIKNNQIKDVEDLENYLSEKAQNHSYYKYYSKRNYIETILTTNAVYLSDGKNWNDTLDRNNFMNSDKLYHKYALCLSYSKSESVAMWLLYSGNDGCMIDYNSKIINCILNTESIILGCFENGEFIEKEFIGKSDFKIELTDIVYYGKDKNNSSDSYYVKRSDEVSQEFSKGLIDKIRSKKKKISWSYENECRIIVSINKNAVKEKYSNIKIPLPADCNKIMTDKTYDSPNYEGNNYRESSLKEDLNWDLCRSCDNNKYGGFTK